MIEEHFYKLLGKKLSGEATLTELSELAELLEIHPEWKDTAAIHSTLWEQSLPFENPETQIFFDRHIERMQKAGIDVNDSPAILSIDHIVNKRKHFFRYAGLAAGTIAAGLAIFFLVRNPGSGNHQQKTSYNQVTTRPASRTQLQLPDGSTVWLNASSDITYAGDFGKEFREVNLTGEAFFDVVKDPAHPFIIHTKTVDVKVLGTAFNVKAYPEDKITETSLIRGRIELTVKNKERSKYFLEPNQKMVVFNDEIINNVVNRPSTDKILVPEKLNYYAKDSTVIETSWVENKLIFQEKETFLEVAKKMERWFGVHIVFTDQSVANLRPFGSFTTETITQALDALKELTKFNYKMNGNEITISP